MLGGKKQLCPCCGAAYSYVRSACCASIANTAWLKIRPTLRMWSLLCRSSTEFRMAAGQRSIPRTEGRTEAHSSKLTVAVIALFLKGRKRRSAASLQSRSRPPAQMQRKQLLKEGKIYTVKIMQFEKSRKRCFSAMQRSAHFSIAGKQQIVVFCNAGLG
jgi:hypothetical protein